MTMKFLRNILYLTFNISHRVVAIPDLYSCTVSEGMPGAAFGRKGFYRLNLTLFNTDFEIQEANAGHM